jgi:hypothetical protein
MLQCEDVLSIIRVLDIPAPRTVAHSPSGCAILWPPAGQIMTGKLMGVPSTVVASVRSVTSRKKRGAG